MKTLSAAHIKNLDAFDSREYLQRCVEDLKEIAFCNPYPKDESEYPAFVTHVYGVAKKYGLNSPKEAFALMLAWHVRGENFVREKRVIELFEKEKSSYVKYQYLMNIAVETIEAYEKQGEER